MATPQSVSLLPPQQRPGPYRDVSARTSITRVDMVDSTDPQDSPPDDELVDEEQPISTPVPEQELVPQTPQTALTFLLVSGRRRTMSFDPDTTVARVKELVWSAWPSGGPPPAPSYLRILYLGKILQDDDTLAKLGFPSHLPPPSTPTPEQQAAPPPPPTIVHLSVRAYAPPADDALKKKKSSRRRGPATDAAGNPTSAAGAPEDGADEDASGCCCVVC
ncbi:hypothetical protein FB451DRAFT_1392171 [Mycena latifolia]|nr:hypothetical protein FB451DRAFT_1392171 [Mycena latifolia]